MIRDLVSTIIPVQNRPYLIREAVASVLNQTYRPIEIIIVDDGSTDDTARVLDELASSNDLIRTLTQENCGPGVAREAGRQLAKGEFIQYLDSDDLLMPDKFVRQVTGLIENPHCDVAYGMTRYSHSNGIHEMGPWKRSGEKIEAMFPSFLQSRWWDTPNPIYRSSVCDKAGPWSSLRLEEDWEYDCRIAATGARLCYVPEYVCIVRDHDNHRLCRGGSDDPSRIRQRATAHKLIFQHAQQAGITCEVPEMQHFARELFLLSRQCGAAGLADESRRLFELARTASIPEISSGLQFRAYRIASSLLGWRATGKLSAQLDKFRNDPA